MFNHQPKRILIAPLDWGLGHTSRCIPIIGHIIKTGNVPIVAGNTAQRSFIEETFGAIDFIHLDGYGITYSGINRWFQAGVLAQVPRMLSAIKSEHQWLQLLTEDMHIDGVISDNRYGLYRAGLPSVIMTHQLNVQSGMGARATRAIQKIHYNFLNRFDATWVVDAPGEENLAGDLSHPVYFPNQYRYLGLLSRFPASDGLANTSGADPLVIMLSGPEPQRSRFSDLLWKQARDHPGEVVFIEGSCNAKRQAVPGHITWYSQLSAGSLAPILTSARMIISRSGYSTLMDLVALSKPAMVVPTPGQTEQEYLARHLHNRGLFYAQRQNTFHLAAALKGATDFPFEAQSLQPFYTKYIAVLDEWIATL